MSRQTRIEKLNDNIYESVMGKSFQSIGNKIENIVPNATKTLQDQTMKSLNTDGDYIKLDKNQRKSTENRDYLITVNTSPENIAEIMNVTTGVIDPTFLNNLNVTKINGEPVINQNKESLLKIVNKYNTPPPPPPAKGGKRHTKYQRMLRKKSKHLRKTRKPMPF